MPALLVLLMIHQIVHSSRLHFDPSTGQITDQWTWRGASTDEAKWLLTRSYKPFDLSSFIKDGTGASSPSSGSSPTSSLDATAAAVAAAMSPLPWISHLNSPPVAVAGHRHAGASAAAGMMDNKAAAKARAKNSAVLFREVFGAVPGADAQQLDAALSQSYKCQVCVDIICRVWYTCWSQ